jgi:hypothetical protein
MWGISVALWAWAFGTFGGAPAPWPAVLTQPGFLFALWALAAWSTFVGLRLKQRRAQPA